MCKFTTGTVRNGSLFTFLDETPGGADMDESSELQSIKTRVVKLLGCGKVGNA